MGIKFPKHMKQGIHPEWKEADVFCVCGENFKTHSTKSTLKVEICSKCHPFFTGKQKIVDTEGRVEKFFQRYKMTEELEKIKNANKN